MFMAVMPSDQEVSVQLFSSIYVFNIDMIFITLLVEGYGCRLKALGAIQSSDRDLGLLCHLTGLGSGQLHQVSFPCVPVIDYCQDLTICSGCGICDITAVNITVQPVSVFR